MKTTATIIATLTLGLALTACEPANSDCDAAGRVQDVTTLSMGERISGGTSGGSRGRSSGSRSGTSKRNGTSISGTSGSRHKHKADDDWFEECDD